MDLYAAGFNAHNQLAIASADLSLDPADLVHFRKIASANYIKIHFVGWSGSN